MTSEQNEDKVFRILSADGGGVHGVSYLSILEHLEKHLGCGIASSGQFQMFIGTSTGTIITTALKLGIKAEEIKQLYLKQAKEIFKPDWLFNQFFNKYGSYRLQHTLTQVLGDLTWQDLEKYHPEIELVLTFWNVSKGKFGFLSTDPRRFDKDAIVPPHSGEDFDLLKEAKVADIITACCAGPFFFPPRVFEKANKTQIYCDGGISSLNNPSAFGVSLASSQEKHSHNIHVLSLGSGEIEREYGEDQIKTWTALEAILNTIDSFMSSSENLMDKFFQYHATNVGVKKYLRTNQKRIPDSMLDDIYSIDELAKGFTQGKIYAHKLCETQKKISYDKIEKLTDENLTGIWNQYFELKPPQTETPRTNEPTQKRANESNVYHVPLWIKATAWPEWGISVAISLVLGAILFCVGILRLFINVSTPSTLKSRLANQKKARKEFWGSLSNSQRGLIYCRLYERHIHAQAENSVISFECRSTWIKRPDIIFAAFFLVLVVGVGFYFYDSYRNVEELNSAVSLLTQIISGKDDKVDEKTIENLVQKAVYETQYPLAENRNRVKIFFARYGHIPSSLLQRFAEDKDSDARVKAVIADHVNVPENLLGKLNQEKDRSVRMAVAQSINASDEMLKKLAQDPDEIVKKEAERQIHYRSLSDAKFRQFLGEKYKEEMVKGMVEVAYDNSEKMRTTGAIVSKEGHIIIPHFPYYYSLEKYKAIVDGQKYPMNPIDWNEELGVAVFQIQKKDISPINWAEEPKIVEEIIAVTPIDMKFFYEKNSISKFYKENPVGMVDSLDAKFVSITFNANRVDGYGPLLNMQGKSVGLLYQGRISSEQGHINKVQAVRSDRIKEYLQRLGVSK